MSRWNTIYRAMPPAERQALNELVNQIFKEQSGVSGKIDPKTHPQHATEWTAIRDRILENRQKFATWLAKSALRVYDVVQATSIYKLLSQTPQWIAVARSQIGQQEIAGAQHNRQIMEYIWTCTNIQETENQRRYVTREGEEGVDWCSAFVNWCLKQAGVAGTNHALASSWKEWGTALDGPRQGAICGFNWTGGSRIDHVAFCDQVDGAWRMLGGNQSDSHSGGIVSSVAFKKQAVKFYRWPG